MSVFGLICIAAPGMFGHAICATGLVLSATRLLGADTNGLLLWGLLVFSLLLGANAVLDLAVVGKTSVR